MDKMYHIEEANAGIAIAMASIDDKEMAYFLPQKSVKTNHFGYTYG